MTVVSIDFAATRLDREKLVISVAGLISANPETANAEGVAAFAAEVRHWNGREPDRFYCDVIVNMDHAAALEWARDILDVIPSWRDAIFNEAKEARQ